MGKVGGNQRVEVVTAQSHVTRRELHLENAPGQFEHRHVEGAAPQVVNGIGTRSVFHVSLLRQLHPLRRHELFAHAQMIGGSR